MSRIQAPRSRPHTQESVSRSLSAAGFVFFVVLSVVGCGSGGSGSVVSVRRPHGEAEELAGRMQLGTSVQAALRELGRPSGRAVEGRDEALDYGIWDLEFEGGRLARKSTERFPKGGVRPKSNFDKVVLGLTLGETVAEVRPKLGRPERIVETWEGHDERVTELGYGGWKISFVNGRLEQRTHT
jgi:hypothetical protein